MAWSRGDVIMWTYRRGVIPMRVVEDSDRALVVWQAPQTVYLQATPRDGTPLRERPVAERFTIERDFAVVPWLGDGTLRIAQPGAAHSSWLWIDWRPDPEWSVPPLPDEFAAMAGMASYDVFPATENG